MKVPAKNGLSNLRSYYITSIKYIFSCVVSIFKQIFPSYLPKSKRKKNQGLSSPRIWTKTKVLITLVQVSSHVHLKNPSLRPRFCLGELFSPGARISSHWAEHGTKMILLRCFYQKQELDAVSRWRMSILLTDSQALCWLLTERQAWLGFFLPSQNLTPPVYVNTPLPIHLLKSKF